VSRAKGKPSVSVEQRLRIVLSVPAGEISMAEAARRHGVHAVTVAQWRDRFIDAGRGGLEDKPSGPAGSMSAAERRLREEAEQLKLALAEATVQLRIWQKGAELVDQVPSTTSRR
jgi:transposase